MGDGVFLLVTVLYESEGTLLRCGLAMSRPSNQDLLDYPMEPENRQVIHAMLPYHVQTCGPVVAVEELFDIVDNRVD